jgi:hypothetical protein
MENYDKKETEKPFPNPGKGLETSVLLISLLP